MQKLNYLVLILTIALCCQTKIAAQPTGETLDQVELMKQFIGTWKSETGEDTVIVLTFTPFGIAMKFDRKIEILADDKVHNYNLSGIYGFSTDRNRVEFVGAVPEGSISYDHGRFVTPTKYVAEMYVEDMKHPIALEEIEFLSPETMVTRSKFRGRKMSWDIGWEPSIKFRKID